MNVFNHFEALVRERIESLSADGTLPGGLDCRNGKVEPPRDASHGDLAVNAAMVLAKQAQMPPRAIAEPLAAALAQNPDVDAAEIAGPGFINLGLSPGF